jgi:uncharacterized membrane protein (UPF0127 family)
MGLQSSGLARLRWRTRSLASGLLTALFLAACLGGCQSLSGSPTVVLTGSQGSVEVAVELALTHTTQSRGLMFRNSMPEMEGMLFIFPQAERRAFWMKNTPLSLDIIYIGDDRKIVSIAEHTVPYSEATIPSRGRARFVLEVNAGFSSRHGIEAGQSVDFVSVPAPAPAPAPN